MLPLFLVGVVLALVVAFFTVASSKRFEQRFFRIDSDNLSWVFVSVVLLVVGVYQIASFDYAGVQSAAVAFGYFLVVFLMFAGTMYSLRRAKAIAIKKRQAK